MNRVAALRSDTFRDFDDYASAIEDVDLSIRLPRLDRSLWTMQQVNLPDSINIQVAHERSGSLPIGAVREDGFILFLAEGDCRANGERLDRDSVFLMPSGREFCLPTKGESVWISVFIPFAVAEATGLVTPHMDAVGNSARLVHSSHGAAERLRSRIKRFVANAQVEPGLLQEVTSVTSFQDELTDCVKDCLFVVTEESKRRSGRPKTVHAGLINWAVELIEHSPETTSTVAELVAALGISERSIQSGFQEYAGVTPQKYLELSRLHRARKQLLTGPLPETTVTKVAAEVGMWDFGRFARRYAMVFGEKPSETLKRRELRRVTSQVGAPREQS